MKKKIEEIQNETYARCGNCESWMKKSLCPWEIAEQHPTVSDGPCRKHVPDKLMKESIEQLKKINKG